MVSFVCTQKAKCRNTLLIIGARPQTHLGGHQIFARKVCHCDDISKKKKKKGHRLFRCTFYAIKRVSKQMLTFFFFFWRCYCSDKFFGKNVRTLTQIARRIKSCPKFLQPGGASAPPDPPLRTPMLLITMRNLFTALQIGTSKSVNNPLLVPSVGG